MFFGKQCLGATQAKKLVGALPQPPENKNITFVMAAHSCGTLSMIVHVLTDVNNIKPRNCFIVKYIWEVHIPLSSIDKAAKR